MTSKRIYSFIFFIFYGFSEIFCQIHWLQRQFVSDSAVHISWAPSSLSVWKTIYNNGFIVERIAIEKENISEQFKSKYEVIFKFDPKIIGYDSSAANTNEKAGFISTILEPNKNENKTIAENMAQINRDNNQLLFGILISMTDLRLSRKFGLAFTDSNIFPNKLYGYKVKWNSDCCMDSLMWMINAATKDVVETPPVPEISLQNENEVQIHWKSSLMVKHCYGFFIERSLDDGHIFHPIHKEPIFYGMGNDSSYNLYIDTVNEFKGLVKYRINAKSMYDNKSNFSDTSQVEVLGKAKLELQQLPIQIKDNQYFLQWEANSSSPSSIESFKILYSDSIDGYRNELITLNPNTMEYPIPASISSAYFWVELNAIGGVYLFSNPVLFQAVDSMAPNTVNGITGIVDSLGIVKLNWNCNSEKDILGYQIYSANSRYSEFSNLSPSWQIDTSYCDTLDLNFMRDSLYYCIKAADKRYNESIPSQIIAIPLPDIAPPETPLITSAYHTDSGIVIHFKGMENTKNIHYSLFRQEANEIPLLFCKMNDLPLDFVLDSQVKENVQYVYQVEIKKLSNQKTAKSLPVIVKVEERTWLNKIVISEIWTDTIKQKIYIKWIAPNLAVQSYRIIQMFENKSKSFSVDGNTTEIYIEQANKNEIPQISIIAYAKDGRRSKP